MIGPARTKDLEMNSRVFGERRARASLARSGSGLPFLSRGHPTLRFGWRSPFQPARGGVSPRLMRRIWTPPASTFSFQRV